MMQYIELPTSSKHFEHAVYTIVCNEVMGSDKNIFLAAHSENDTQSLQFLLPRFQR